MVHLHATGIAGIVTIVIIVIIVVIIISWLFGRRRALDLSLSDVFSDDESHYDERLHDKSGHKRHGDKANKKYYQGGKRQSKKCDCDETPPTRYLEKIPVRRIESESCPSSESTPSCSDSSSSSSGSSESCKPCNKKNWHKHR